MPHPEDAYRIEFRCYFLCMFDTLGAQKTHLSHNGTFWHILF